jgi:hypothetical protein
LETNQLDRDEGRSIGLETSTGLDIVLKDCFRTDLTDAIGMLKAGRELWYWNGEDRSIQAYDLMRKACKLLGKYELIRILDAHFQNRHRPSVDLVQR